jgi:Plasmid pRiA4b ORF-3-like protein
MGRGARSRRSVDSAGQCGWRVAIRRCTPSADRSRSNRHETKSNAKITPAQSRRVAHRTQGGGAARLRVLVPDNWTLATLHNYLQWVMGWTDSHAHEFEIGAGLVAPDWWIREAWSEEEANRYRDERRVSVAAVVAELGPRGQFEYRYDMGDGWAHRIVIESAPPWAAGEFPLPVCVAGENACPPEDVGGPHGYAEFLRALGERRREQHEDMARWIGGVFDPKGFDLNRINRDWKGARRRRR